MPQNIKHTIMSIPHLKGDDSPLIDYLRIWMEITDLDFKDVIHLTPGELTAGLGRVTTKLHESVDIFDEDQLREAACRCLKSISVYGEMITDGDVAVHQQQRIEWDGSKWNFLGDPKLRQPDTSTSYREALRRVQESLAYNGQ